MSFIHDTVYRQRQDEITCDQPRGNLTWIFFGILRLGLFFGIFSGKSFFG